MRATTTEPPWLVTPEKVHAVVGRLIEMAHPKQIILFGSYARGKITEDSDLDVLIVAGDEVENTRRESVRLSGALKEIEMPIDIVVEAESARRPSGVIATPAHITAVPFEYTNQSRALRKVDLRGNARRPIVQKVVPHYCARSFPCQRC